MAAVNFRYYTWLLNAYFKKWKKTILLSLLLGIAIFFIFFYFLQLYIEPLFQKKVQRIGYSGVYTASTLPEEFLDSMSYGLTTVEPNGTIGPGAAYKWDIKNGGKEYVFYLKKGQYFHDGTQLSSNNLILNYKDVKEQAIDSYTIDFKLKSPYAPFLATVSRPYFLNGFVGLGKYKLNNLDLNAGFVISLSLQEKDDPEKKENIIFYPTEDALKTAFMLGNVDEVIGLTSTVLDNKNLLDWKNATVSQSTDYSELVTLFYNNADPVLSDKKVRQALSYALPASFRNGVRAFSPIPPTSFYFSKPPNYGVTDPDISRTLLSSSNSYKNLTFEISTTNEFLNDANAIKNAWSKIGVKTKIKIVDDIPPSFQMLLYKFKIPKDPDQYTLWHSNGVNNIANYKNLRIDKLLEDGRLTTNMDDRIKIYSDFQKYLLDDVPASFLYFPYKYIVEKK